MWRRPAPWRSGNYGPDEENTGEWMPLVFRDAIGYNRSDKLFDRYEEKPMDIVDEIEKLPIAEISSISSLLLIHKSNFSTSVLDNTYYSAK